MSVYARHKVSMNASVWGLPYLSSKVVIYNHNCRQRACILSSSKVWRVISVQSFTWPHRQLDRVQLQLCQGHLTMYCKLWEPANKRFKLRECYSLHVCTLPIVSDKAIPLAANQIQSRSLPGGESVKDRDSHPLWKIVQHLDLILHAEPSFRTIMQLVHFRRKPARR